MPHHCSGMSTFYNSGFLRLTSGHISLSFYFCLSFYIWNKLLENSIQLCFPSSSEWIDLPFILSIYSNSNWSDHGYHSTSTYLLCICFILSLYNFCFYFNLPFDMSCQVIKLQNSKPLLRTVSFAVPQITLQWVCRELSSILPSLNYRTESQMQGDEREMKEEWKQSQREQICKWSRNSQERG